MLKPTDRSSFEQLFFIDCGQWCKQNLSNGDGNCIFVFAILINGKNVFETSLSKGKLVCRLNIPNFTPMIEMITISVRSCNVTGTLQL